MSQFLNYEGLRYFKNKLASQMTNIKSVTGTYTGDNTTTVTLRLSVLPIFVIIYREILKSSHIGTEIFAFLDIGLGRGISCSYHSGPAITPLVVSNSGTSITFKADPDSMTNQNLYVCNEFGYTYRYFIYYNDNGSTANTQRNSLILAASKDGIESI